MLRQIIQEIRGTRTMDGAGVRLVRVLGGANVYDFDPFLMLDSFDSGDPEDYIKGFPMHPHRGIETITYLIEGDIEHKDSLGNQGSILSGQSQWMTAGSGILHQEMPQPANRMLGFQLWLNLPKNEKMAPSAYFEITQEMIPVVDAGGADVRVIAGAYGGIKGPQPQHIKATILDVTIPAGGVFELDTKTDETVFAFTILGSAEFGRRIIPEKTAILFGPGDHVEARASGNVETRCIFFSGRPLHEPIAWGGPIVMNTQAELDLAFRQLRNGTFIS